MALDEGVKTKKMSQVGGGGRDRSRFKGRRAREEELEMASGSLGPPQKAEFDGEIIRGCGNSTAVLYLLTKLL